MTLTAEEKADRARAAEHVRAAKARADAALARALNALASAAAWKESSPWQ